MISIRYEKQDGTVVETEVEHIWIGGRAEEKLVQAKLIAELGTAERMVQEALRMEGKPYRFGAEVDLCDSDPVAFDCSELVEWAVHQAGGDIPDGSKNQLMYCCANDTDIPVEEAIHIRGALLFAEGHVAISLGDGRTVEAMNSKRGVCYGKASAARFTAAALVPGLRYGDK